MTGARAQAPLPDDPTSFVSADVAALASHMDTCRHSRESLFLLRSGGDFLRGLVSSRIVSTGARIAVAVVARFLCLA
jgi:hypothetical protein